MGRGGFNLEPQDVASFIPYESGDCVRRRVVLTVGGRCIEKRWIKGKLVVADLDQPLNILEAISRQTMQSHLVSVVEILRPQQLIRVKVNPPLTVKWGIIEASLVCLNRRNAIWAVQIYWHHEHVKAVAVRDHSHLSVEVTSLVYRCHYTNRFFSNRKV